MGQPPQPFVVKLRKCVLNLNDQQTINASKEQVFAGLNDADILRQCIPGCQVLEKTSDTEMSATVVLKVGPVKAKFAGNVTLSNLNPPESYTITGEGKGGAAGFAKGGADITLHSEADGTTTLKYAVKVSLGGKIAQLGGRLMESTSRKLANQFFEKFAELVEPAEGTVPDAEPEIAVAEIPVSDAGSEQTNASPANHTLIIVLAVIGVVAVTWYFAS